MRALRFAHMREDASRFSLPGDFYASPLGVRIGGPARQQPIGTNRPRLLVEESPIDFSAIVFR